MDNKKEEYPSFEAFLNASKAYFEGFYESNIIPKFKAVLERLKSQASPFASRALRDAMKKDW